MGVSSTPAGPGRIGRYTLIERIATGGMGEVFRAEEPRPIGAPRTVVVKRMLGRVASTPGARRRFEREARLAALVRHPKVVEVLDVGEHDGQPFLVLEYVRGLDLGRLLRRLRQLGRQFDEDLIPLLARDLLEGLSAVHEARGEQGEPLGIVHRDISPSNVLVSVYGEVKLADFGLAREGVAGGRRMGDRTGKLGYLSPEQVAGEAVGQASDLFAAGVVIAELLMGRPLFTGGSELAVLLAVRDVKVGDFLDVAARMPPGLPEAVLRALARRPERRHRSARQFLERIAPLVPRDEEPLRARLGALVREMMSIVSPSEAPVPSSTASVTDPLAGGSLEGAEFSAPSLLISGEDGPEEETATSDLPVLEYRVQRSDGVRFGPWTYARLVEAIATGDVGPDDRIDEGRGPKPVRDVPELASHLPRASLTPVTQDVDDPSAPTRTISMAGGGLVEAFARAAMDAETGMWLCEMGAARKEVYFREGAPEFVSSNLAGELLGEYLVTRGVVSRGELDMALAVMPRFEGRLGETLVALGLVEPVELIRHMSAQVRQKLLDLFVWRQGEARFFPGVPPPTRAFPLGLDPWAVIDEGIAKRMTSGLEEETLRGHLLSHVAKVSGALDLAQTARLPEPARQMLSMLQRPLSLPELVDRMASRDDPNRGYRVVLLLLALGLVRWAD